MLNQRNVWSVLFQHVASQEPVSRKGLEEPRAGGAGPGCRMSSGWSSAIACEWIRGECPIAVPGLQSLFQVLVGVLKQRCGCKTFGVS